MNEELELLYKALSTSIDLGSYEQFASGMQNPKNRAKLVGYIKSKNLGLDVSEYTLEKWSQGKASQVGTKVEPSRNQAAKSDLDRFNEGFDVAQAEQLPVEPTPPNQAPVSMGVPKTGPLSLAEPQPTGKEKVLTGLEGVPISELYNQFKSTRSQLEGLDPQAEGYNTLVTQFNNIGAEINNRGVNEPYKQFVVTSPQYREERRKMLAQKQPAEARLQTLEQQLFSQEKEYNPLGEVTARANGFESYEEMRLATNAGLTEADLKQKPNPPSKDQTDAIVTFLGEHYQNIPQSDKVELERYLIELAGSNPDQFWRTVRLSTPDSPLVGVGKAALLGGMAGISNVIDKIDPDVKASTKARLLEDTYVNKLGKLKTELSNIEARISSDPNLGAEYAVFADALNVVSQLEEKKGRTPQEEQQLQDALTAISNLQTPEVKQYAATLAQYKTDYKNLSNVLTNFPEELARRALLDFKNKQQVIQPTDNVATKVAKQMQAIKGSAANTALRIGGTTLKTIAAMPDRLARAITGQEYTSTAERYFEETGKFIESAIFLPELPENMRSSIAQDLMGQTKIRGEAVLPGIATGLVQMGALVFGGQALGSAKLLNSSAAGLTASGFVFEFNDMYESFLNEGLSSRAALGLAAGISYVVARMELISPQGVGLSFLDQSVKGAVKELSKATTKDFVPAFAQGSLYMMKQLGLENLQEFSQDGAKTIGNFLINKAYGTNLEDSFETEQIAETALITTGTTFIFTLLTGKSQRRGEAYEAAKYLAEKPEQLEAELQRRVSSNRMTAEQARQVYNYVQDVKKTEDANKAKEAFDKKIEGYVQGKPVVEDYEGPTEISAEDFFAADYSVPSGVIVDLDGTKYEVTNDDKGVTLTIVELEEKTEQTPEGETVTSQQVKPTKQKLTVEEFNELYQAPQGDRVADEVKVGNVATYQGKEYRITDVTQDGVTLENYAGSARMTVPASQVQAFTVQPLSTYTYKGQQYSINQQQKTAIENIDQVEQEQLEKYQDDTARVKRIKKDFEQSRRQALGLAPTQVAVGDEMFLNGRPVKVLGKRGSKVTVDMEGAQMSVEQADLSLSDNTELRQSQTALKEKIQGPQKGHVFKIKGGQMSKEDTKAYMKVNRVVADQINRAKKYTQVLPDMEVEVYESVEQARQAAIDAGAPESVVRGMNVGGRDISYFEEVNDTESEVTYLDGTKELVPTADIRENTFGGFWDGKNRIIINASHATNTTVAHEILHPVIESILKNKPEVVQRFFDQLKNEPDYQSIRSFVEQYDTATQPIEALVEFVARVATPEFNFKKRKASFKRKVVDFFKRLFGMVDTVNINTDNVLDFAQGLADYLQKGRAINIEQERSEGRFSRSREDAIGRFYELVDEANAKVVGDYRSGKTSQTIVTLRPEQIEKVWNRYIRSKEVDEKQLEKIERIFIRNTALLESNTVLSGHTSADPKYIIEDWFEGEEIPEGFEDWLYDYLGPISDYGLEPLVTRAVELLQTDSPERRLQLLDEMLNIIHHTSDLSTLFVEGGASALNFIGGYHQAIPPPPEGQRRNYGRDDVWGRFQRTAPNGKPSNLTPQQYRQVRTPEFKAWFGPWDTDPENASKVVDENGEPRVVFHGTMRKDLTVLDPTKGLNIDAVYHTKDVEVAAHWSGTTRVKSITDDDISKIRSLNNLEDVLDFAGKVLSGEFSVEENYTTPEEAKMFGVKPGYFYTLTTPSGSSPLLSLRGPKKASGSETLEAVKKEILQTLEFYKSYEATNSGKTYANFLNIRNPLVVDAKGRSYHLVEYKGRTMNTESIASDAAQSNYDGVIVENVLETDYENFKTTDYISFEPTQIKSAVSNVGTFDATNPDIRFQRTGFHGTPHRFPKEILVQKPDGTQEYLVGTPDEFPIVPPDYTVIREFPNGRFRMDKMGTGEGAQAYGWGMYFTELEDIARWYADKLRQWGAEEKAINDIARQELDSFSGDKAKAIASLEQTLKEPWADKKRVKAAIRVIKTGKELAIPKTNLLQVTLHKGKDPSEYTWLDWDQPVGRVLADKINAHIKDKRLPTLSDTSGAGLRRSLGMPPSDIMIYPSITTGLDGGYAYRELVEYFKEKNRTDKPAKYVPAEQQASLFLLEAGIDGIRFPAESKPRDKARGFNYVVFDENAIEIEQVTRFQRTNTLQQAIANGTVTFTDAKGNPCARGGFKQKKVTRGGTWQIIKEFKGKTHEQGGIDVEIKDGQISMTRGETKLEAKYGLLI